MGTVICPLDEMLLFTSKEYDSLLSNQLAIRYELNPPPEAMTDPTVPKVGGGTQYGPGAHD
jgi:hypothetical protein